MSSTGSIMAKAWVQNTVATVAALAVVSTATLATLWGRNYKKLNKTQESVAELQSKLESDHDAAEAITKTLQSRLGEADKKEIELQRQIKELCAKHEDLKQSVTGSGTYNEQVFSEMINGIKDATGKVEKWQVESIERANVVVEHLVKVYVQILCQNNKASYNPKDTGKISGAEAQKFYYFVKFLENEIDKKIDELKISIVDLSSMERARADKIEMCRNFQIAFRRMVISEVFVRVMREIIKKDFQGELSSSPFIQFIQKEEMVNGVQRVLDSTEFNEQDWIDFKEKFPVTKEYFGASKEIQLKNYAISEYGICSSSDYIFDYKKSKEIVEIMKQLYSQETPVPVEVMVSPCRKIGEGSDVPVDPIDPNAKRDLGAELKAADSDSDSDSDLSPVSGSESKQQ